MFDWRRISSRWYGVIVLVAAVPGVIGMGVYLAFGGHPAPLVAPAAIAAVLVVNLVTASAEELGWRGYALEPLQARLSALHASLILGVVWRCGTCRCTSSTAPTRQRTDSAHWRPDPHCVAAAAVGPLQLIYKNTGRSILAAAASWRGR